MLTGQVICKSVAVNVSPGRRSRSISSSLGNNGIDIFDVRGTSSNLMVKDSNEILQYHNRVGI